MQFLRLELESRQDILPSFLGADWIFVLEAQNASPFIIGCRHPNVDKILFIGFWLIS